MEKTSTTVINKVIKCPHCGREYHPAELFMPGDLLGKPDTIIRDALGKILYEDYDTGNEPEFTTRYICDECNKPFVVEAQVTYKSRPEEEELDFSTESVSLLDD